MPITQTLSRRERRTQTARVPAIRVLGTVEIAGSDRPFASTKAIEVVIYLALHRDGADSDQLRSHLWRTGDQPTAQAFANVMSRARLGLGRDEHGDFFLGRVPTTLAYRLDPRIRTDVDEFEDLTRRARGIENPDEEIDLLNSALRLVRGVPFTGTSADGFLWADHLIRAEIHFIVDEAAHRCAELALDRDRLETARNAIFAGLRIIPGCERCYENRFRLAVLEQNVTELKAAMTNLEVVLAGETDARSSGAHGDSVSHYLRSRWVEMADRLAR